MTNNYDASGLIQGGAIGAPEITSGEKCGLATPPLWHTDTVGGVHPINLPAHKVKGVREVIEAAGASLIYLPPYSPDLNPIEKAFAKLKAILRKAAARTLEDLWEAIAHALAALTPQECLNYFAACGYGQA
jgi:transposase